jgi:hypothetical protein
MIEPMALQPAGRHLWRADVTLGVRDALPERTKLSPTLACCARCVCVLPWVVPADSVQIWNLQRVLSKKKDPLSHTRLIDGVSVDSMFGDDLLTPGAALLRLLLLCPVFVCPTSRDV